MALSRFSGQYKAVAFNYGGNGIENPGPLVVVAGTIAAGTAGTLTVQNGWTATTDGTVFFPLNVNAPVSVVNAAGADTQTPNAVSNNVQSNLYGPTATVSAANWTNAHYPGDRVSSGTVGLQEAINYASLMGGGTVIVDAAWVTQGGTAAILAAATIPATVNILDNRTGGAANVQSVTVAIPNSAVLTLYSVPTTLITAPGSGNLIDVVDMTVEHVYKTAQFSAGGAIQASYGTGVSYPASATIATSFLNSASANQVIKVAGALANTASSNCANQPVIFTCASQDFTTGGGSLIVKVNYRVLTGF